MENLRQLELAKKRDQFETHEDYWKALGARPEETEIFFYHHKTMPIGWPSDWK